MSHRKSTALALAFACMLTACATTTSVQAPLSARLQQIKFQALSDANQGNALNVDVVYVFSESAIVALPQNELDWFAKKPALMQNLGPGIEVISATISPGTTGGINTPRDKKFISAIAYSNHVDPGAQAAGQLALYKCASIVVKDKSIAYVECS